MVAETEYEEVWRDAGCESFDQFLSSNHLAKVDRYRSFRLGVERSSLTEALNHGASWTMALGHMASPSAKVTEEFTARAVAFLETEHVAPTEETVREWRAQVQGSQKKHATIRKVDELNRLRAENATLKAENAALKKRIADLEDKSKKKAA